MKPLFVLFFAMLYAATGFAQCDNLKPMFGDNCAKNTSLQKADDQFRKEATKKFGSADSAAKAYLQMGWNSFKKRDDATAMKRFNQAWLLSPQHPAVYFAFGHLVRFAFTKNATEAERFYKLARLHDPESKAELNSLLTVMDALDSRNDPEASITAGTDLIVKYPAFGNGFGYKKRAEYYTALQMPDRALKDWEKAIPLNPKDASVYSGRGYAYFWLQDHPKALADYNMAITLDPDFAEAYARRAQLYTDSLVQLSSALTDIEKALKLDAKKTEYYRIKSNILFKQNRKTDACKWLKNAIASGHKTLEADYKERCGK